jgi:hypothetical protein
VLANQHWKGIISAFDAHTFRVYDSFALQKEMANFPKERILAINLL